MGTLMMIIGAIVLIGLVILGVKTSLDFIDGKNKND